MTDVQDMLELTRVLNAPREKVWQAWTDPEILARWWWPVRFQTVYEVDLRVDGHYAFRTPDLPDMGILAVTGTYLEVRPPERLVYTWQWEGEGEPPTQVTIGFLARGDQTEVRITHQGFSGEGERANHLTGWQDCLTRLESLVAGSPPDA